MNILTKFLRWLKGEVVTINLNKGTATLMTDGMVIIKQDGSTDGIPIDLCSREVILKFAKALKK